MAVRLFGTAHSKSVPRVRERTLFKLVAFDVVESRHEDPFNNHRHHRN